MAFWNFFYFSKIIYLLRCFLVICRGVLFELLVLMYRTKACAVAK